MHNIPWWKKGVFCVKYARFCDLRRFAKNIMNPWIQKNPRVESNAEDEVFESCSSSAKKENPLRKQR